MSSCYLHDCSEACNDGRDEDQPEDDRLDLVSYPEAERLLVEPVALLDDKSAVEAPRKLRQQRKCRGQKDENDCLRDLLDTKAVRERRRERARGPRERERRSL